MLISFYSDAGKAVEVLNRCLKSVPDWLRANKWKLSPSKMEALLQPASEELEVPPPSGSPPRSGVCLFRTLVINKNYKLLAHKRSLQVQLYPALALSFETHIASMTQSTFHQLKMVPQFQGQPK